MLIDGQPFQNEVLCKDFKGDTPLHKAGKRGNISILEFYLSPTSSTTDRMILDLQNDFGLTVYEAVNDKVKLLEDAVTTKFQQKLPVDKEQEKLRRLKQAATYIQKASVMQEEHAGGAAAGDFSEIGRVDGSGPE